MRIDKIKKKMVESVVVSYSNESSSDWFPYFLSYLSLRLIERVEVLAEGRDDALVPVGVLSEDVLLRTARKTTDRGKGAWMSAEECVESRR